MSTEEKPKAATSAAWKRASVHTIRCHSGVFVDIKLPDLPALIETGQIPQNLMDAAIGYATGNPEKPTKESVARDRLFRDLLVQKTVVEPKLSDDDLANVPIEDKEIIVEFALRQRDRDAEGEHIGGLTSSDKFRKFREIEGSDSSVEGLSSGW